MRRQLKPRVVEAPAFLPVSNQQLGKGLGLLPHGLLIKPVLFVRVFELGDSGADGDMGDFLLLKDALKTCRVKTSSDKSYYRFLVRLQFGEGFLHQNLVTAQGEFIKFFDSGQIGVNAVGLFRKAAVPLEQILKPGKNVFKIRHFKFLAMGEEKIRIVARERKIKYLFINFHDFKKVLEHLFFFGL